MTTNGALFIDKPTGWTSHDVVGRVRRLLGERRVGHAGTLDPMATGLLVLAVGPATRLLRFATASMKVYSGEITFGTATDSLDADGEVVATGPLEVVTPDRVSAAAAGMIGPQQQVPPMVSAIKMGGKKLYELARDGVEVERAPRDITISSFSVVPTDDPATYRFSVTCSVGTYVRVIAQDLATSIGTVAHLSALRREGSGTATVSMAMSLDDLAAKIERGDTVLEAPEVLLGDMPAFDVNDETALAITRGQRVAIAMDEPFVAARYNGQLLGVLAQRSTYFQPDVVFPFVVGN